MGATTFGKMGYGKDAREAFNRAHDEDRNENGSSYSGTLASKPGFVEVPAFKGKGAKTIIKDIEKANQLRHEEKKFTSKVPGYADFINRYERVYDDKWAQALCIKVAAKAYYFFGWASE